MPSRAVCDSTRWCIHWQQFWLRYLAVGAHRRSPVPSVVNLCPNHSAWIKALKARVKSVDQAVRGWGSLLSQGRPPAYLTRKASRGDVGGVVDLSEPSAALEATALPARVDDLPSLPPNGMAAGLVCEHGMLSPTARRKVVPGWAWGILASLFPAPVVFEVGWEQRVLRHASRIITPLAWQTSTPQCETCLVGHADTQRAISQVRVPCVKVNNVGAN